MRLTIFLCAIALLALTLQSPRPLRVRAAAWAAAPTVLRLPGPTPTPNLETLLRRDPFVPPKGVAIIRQSPNATQNGIPSNLPFPGAPGGSQPIVPNPGAIEGTQNVAVLGIILGDHHRPMALIQIGSTTAVVGPGDSIGTRRIASITSNGIVFTDKSRLAISLGALPAGSSAAAPLAAPPLAAPPPTIATPTPAPTSPPRTPPTLPPYYRVNPAYFPFVMPGPNSSPIPTVTLPPS